MLLLQSSALPLGHHARMFRWAVLGMRLAERVAKRWAQAFRYVPKEKKQHKVERLGKLIRKETGVSTAVAEGIANAIVRGRDIGALTIQKGWPIEGDTIEGPRGGLNLRDLRSQL